MQTHAKPDSAFFHTWQILGYAVTKDERGDSFMQCGFTENLLDVKGHGVFRSTLHTDGLPRRVELNDDGTMKTKKKDAKNCELHFNCHCVQHFRQDPPISPALQRLQGLLGESEYHGRGQTAVEIQKTSHAVAAVSIVARMKNTNRPRTLSEKAQAILDAQIEKQKEQQEQEEKEQELERTKRNCWKYTTETEECVKSLNFNAVLGGLCTHHARCAVAEAVVFIQTKYVPYKKGSKTLLDFAVVAADEYLSKGRSSVVTSRKLYVKLLHELRFDWLVSSKSNKK